MSRIRADQLVNRVGSGGPKFPNGIADGFSVSGIVTATSYRGDGSQLTGIDASSLKDGSNVKVQAVSGGANVTGNVAATGNVTAVDGTFSGNLTVQGTTTTIDTAVTAVDSLAVDGNITALGSVAIGTDSPSASHNLTVRGSNDNTFTNNPSNIFVAGIDTSGSGNSGAGINFGGRYRDDNGNTTAFAVVSGIKENTTHNNWAGALTFATRENGNAGGNQERLRIDSGGRLLLGTTDAGSNNTANHLVVSNNAGANDQAGMTIRGGTSGRSQIFFSDGNSGQDEYRGMLRYDHQDNSMQFRTNATERLRIGSDGEIGLSGANYGTAGQVLTSQGSGSAPQWATPAASGTFAGARSTNPNTTLVEWTSLPANIQTIEVGYADAYASTNNAENERIVLRLGTSAGYLTSNYKNRSWNMYASAVGLGFNSSKSAFIPYYWIDNTDRATNMFILRRMGTSNTFQATWQEYIAGGHSYIAMGTGYVDLGAELTQVRLQTTNNNATLNGSFWMNYTTR